MPALSPFSPIIHKKTKLLLQHPTNPIPLLPHHLFISLKSITTMKSHHHHHTKIKNPPRPLFSCGIFSYCTQTVLSPTNTQAPTLPPPSSSSSDLPPTSHSPPPPPESYPLRPLKARPQSDSESSSSSTSQSFTQWRFPIPKSPVLHPSQSESESDPPKESTSNPSPPELINLPELFHITEIQLTSGSYDSRLSALHLLERSLLPNPGDTSGDDPMCPMTVMSAVVSLIKDALGAKPATKVLLALCLVEGNRQLAVEAGAVNQVVEALAELEGTAAERALAALELLCMVPEGAAELRAHALAVPMMVQVMGKMNGRGKECAISALSVIFGGNERQGLEPPESVARAVVLAMQGECSARGRRKGGQLLKTLQESGRLDVTEQGK